MEFWGQRVYIFQGSPRGSPLTPRQEKLLLWQWTCLGGGVCRRGVLTALQDKEAQLC